MNNYILPAEWYTQSCVQLTWPHEDTDWRDYLDDITETFVQIAKAVAHYEPLVIAAKYPERVREVLAESLNDDEMARVSIYESDNNDTWARDHAFITLVPMQNGQCSIRYGFVLDDLLTNYERIADHCSNIAVALIEVTHGSFDTHAYLSRQKESSEQFSRRYEEYRARYLFPEPAKLPK